MFTCLPGPSKDEEKTEPYLLVVFELNVKPTWSYHSAVFCSAWFQCTESDSAVLHVHVILLLPLPFLTDFKPLCLLLLFSHPHPHARECVDGVCVLVLEGHLNWASVVLSIGSRCQRRKMFPLWDWKLSTLKPQPLLADCFPTFKCILQANLLSPLCNFLIQTSLKVSFSAFYAMLSSPSLSLFNSFFYFFPF